MESPRHGSGASGEGIHRRANVPNANVPLTGIEMLFAFLAFTRLDDKISLAGQEGASTWQPRSIGHIFLLVISC